MNTLRARLVFFYSLMVTLTLALTLFAGFFLVRGQLLKGADFLLDAEFQEIQAKLSRLQSPISATEIERAIGDHTIIDAPFYFFQVHDGAGAILFRSSNLGQKILPDLTHAKIARSTVALGDFGQLRVAEFYAGPLHVQIASSLSYLSALSDRFLRGISIAIPTVLLLSIAIGYLLCEITLRPLRAIEQTARRISVSNLNERIPVPRGKDEIGRLVQLLNAMFDRLEQSFEQIKQFTADFSHELRTPLSIVALHTEKVLKRSDLDPESADALMVVLSETRRLNQIIDQLLTLAKAEAQTLPLHLVSHSTSHFIQDFAEDAVALCDASGKHFKLLQNEELAAEFDASWIRQVIFNLLSNAIKFSPPGGTIEFISAVSDGQWRMTISDEGPGIPPEQSTAIFERFKQLRRSPDDEHQGSGLGLAVSKSIIELHNGSIRCERPESGVGTQITVLLPRVASGSVRAFRIPSPPGISFSNVND